MIRNWGFFIFILLLGSCTSQKDLVYIKNIDISKVYNAKETNMNTELIIGIGDQLSITVDGIDRESIRPFNIQHDLNPSIRSYLVDSRGEITFPVVGKIKVSGLTKNEITNVINEKLSPFLKNPTITVQLENFQVSVLGEVNRPGKYSTQNDRITIFEALSLAGDITLYGKKRNILLTREVNGKIEFARLDLTSTDIFKSEYYFLKQNDIIYVEPNRMKPMNSPNIQTQLSVAGIATTLVTSIVLIIKK